MYHNILIALEGRERDRIVLDHVGRLAAETGAEVTLLRVIGIADDGGGGLGKQMQLEPGSSGWRRRNEAEAFLVQVEAQLRRAGVSARSALAVGTRSEADEIVHYAAANGHDLIAMAADTRPWYKRLLRSAQDDDVLRRATVPTLFVGNSSRRVAVPRAMPQGNAVMAVLGNADL